MNAYLFRREYCKVVIPAKAGIQRYLGCRVEPGMTV
jgi:hypothetical protein